MDLSGLIGEALLRTRSEAIVAADRDGAICFWNPGAERIFGYAASEAIGHSLDLIIPERLRERHWQGFRGTIATGKSRYGEGDVLSVPASHKNRSQDIYRVHDRAVTRTFRRDHRARRDHARCHQAVRGDPAAEAESWLKLLATDSRREAV